MLVYSDCLFLNEKVKNVFVCFEGGKECGGKRILEAGRVTADYRKTVSPLCEYTESPCIVYVNSVRFMVGELDPVKEHSNDSGRHTLQHLPCLPQGAQHSACFGALVIRWLRLIDLVRREHISH